MGLACAPQLANLYAYSIKSQWVDRCPPRRATSRRYIDDIIIAGQAALLPGVGLPTEEDYGMQYKLTSESPDSLIYLGVRLLKGEHGAAHTVLHHRRWTNRSRLTGTRGPPRWPTRSNWGA